MPSLSTSLLQKAIYEKLIGNSPLMALISGVFDHVPQDTSFPFITIGDVSVSELSNLNKTGVEHQLNIHVWSRDAGHKKATDIMEIVYGLLHNGSVSVSGQTFVSMQFISTNIQLENDGWTYHGTMRLRVILVAS